jgi:hypothetical protein
MHKKIVVGVVVSSESRDNVHVVAAMCQKGSLRLSAGRKNRAVVVEVE